MNQEKMFHLIELPQQSLSWCKIEVRRHLLINMLTENVKKRNGFYHYQFFFFKKKVKHTNFVILSSRYVVISLRGDFLTSKLRILQYKIGYRLHWNLTDGPTLQNMKMKENNRELLQKRIY